MYRMTLRDLFAKLTQKKKKEVVRSVGQRVHGKLIFEQIRINGNVCYAVWKGKNKLIEHLKELDTPSTLYKPVERVPWIFPKEPLDYGTEQELWKEVYQCIHDHFDYPDKTSYQILTAWTFATWLPEFWRAVPFLFFYGAHETGKTRALEILSALCMRGWLALYLTPANLYRPLEDWKPSLFLDESEVYGDIKPIIALLNASYRRGQKVARQIETKEGYKTEFYDNFGFKALAGTKSLATTLQSRCIVFRMSRATRKVRLFVDEEQTDQLRSKLLMFRFKKLGEIGEIGEMFRRGGVIKKLEEFGEKLGSGRLAELFYPLQYVAPNQNIKDQIIRYALKLDKERWEELRASDEAIVLSAILRASEQYLDRSRILIKHITDIVNENLPLNEQWYNRRVSAICWRLGFHKTSVHGLTAIKWDSKLIERLKQDPRYKACFEPLPPPSDISPISPISPAKVTENGRIEI